MINNNNYCVIMAGGIGSRFWPYSRKNKPKQFLDFFGTGQTLLQLTFDRYSKIVPSGNIFIATNSQYVDLVKEQLPQLEDRQILPEPARRNTAPCIAWASAHIQKMNPNANVIVAPADHLILKENDAQKVFMEPDVCWLTRGGIKPAEFISRYASRIRQIHMKDSKVPDVVAELTELGNGIVDLKGAFLAAQKADIPWLIYEQDVSKDPFRSAEISLKYLKNL